MSKPVLAVVLLTAMAGAWYWALLPAPPPATRGAPGPVAVVPPSGPGVPTVHLDRLDRRLLPGVTTSDLASPFRRAVEKSRNRTVAAVRDGAGTTSSAPVSLPAWPRLDLIGVAEVHQDGRLVRTAIVAGPAGVQHARPGDVLEGVYRLERIVDDAVEVLLIPEDRTLRLALRR